MDELEALAYADDVRAAYPGRNVPDQAVKRWGSLFEKMSSYEARKVVVHLTTRAVDPPSSAQVFQALNEVRQVTMSGTIDSFRCTYADGVVCMNCDPEGVVHGHLLEPGQVAHGLMHLGRREMEQARAPDRCQCGFDLPANIDVERVVGLVASAVSRVRQVKEDAP